MLGFPVLGKTQGIHPPPAVQSFSFTFSGPFLFWGWYPHTCIYGKVSVRLVFFQTHYSCSSWGYVTVWGLRWVGFSFFGDSLEGLMSGRSCLARAAGLREWGKVWETKRVMCDNPFPASPWLHKNLRLSLLEQTREIKNSYLLLLMTR